MLETFLWTEFLPCYIVKEPKDLRMETLKAFTNQVSFKPDKVAHSAIVSNNSEIMGIYTYTKVIELTLYKSLASPQTLSLCALKSTNVCRWTKQKHLKPTFFPSFTSFRYNVHQPYFSKCR